MFHCHLNPQHQLQVHVSRMRDTAKVRNARVYYDALHAIQMMTGARADVIGGADSDLLMSNTI
jgi:hypothetical protein